MNSIKRFFTSLMCALMLLVGVQSGNLSAWSFDQDIPTEVSLEMEKETQEEVKVDWFAENSDHNPVLSNEYVGPAPKMVPVFFSSLDQKAVENPPEA